MLAHRFHGIPHLPWKSSSCNQRTQSGLNAMFDPRLVRSPSNRYFIRLIDRIKKSTLFKNTLASKVINTKAWKYKCFRSPLWCIHCISHILERIWPCSVLHKKAAHPWSKHRCPSDLLSKLNIWSKFLRGTTCFWLSSLALGFPFGKRRMCDPRSIPFLFVWSHSRPNFNWNSLAGIF